MADTASTRSDSTRRDSGALVADPSLAAATPARRRPRLPRMSGIGTALALG